jgi:hypothetical protein
MKKPAILLPAILWVGILFFCTFHDASAQTNRGLAVSPENLPKSLSEVSPKDYFIPSSEKKVGIVHAMEGTVVVTHRTTKEAYFAAAGDPVFEKDSLTTLAESKCRVRFVDEDIVTMAPDTEFSVDSFEDQRAEGRKSSFFSMVKGRAMFYALRLFRYKDTRFTLATPTTTIGVRGTKFGAHVYFEDSKSASRPVLVADAQNEIAPYLAQAGFGRTFTDCFAEDGTLDVNGIAVPAGQMFSGRTGAVIPTPPDVIRTFRQATEIATGGTTGQAPGTGGTESGAPAPPLPTAVTGGVAPLTADLQASITSIVQVQTGQKTEQANPQGIQSLPGPLHGYFSILLIKGASGAGPFDVSDAFVSSYDPDNFYRPYPTDPSLNARADAIVNTGPGDFIAVSGSPAPDTGTTRLEGVTDSGDKIENTWTKTYVGQKSYTQWGYWQSNQPADFIHDNGNYYRLVMDRAWFLEGNHVTTAAEMPSGNYAYSGGAYGTYQGPQAYALSGAFNCQVNFGAAQVQNFNLDVGDGDAAHRVIINQSTSISVNRNANGNYFTFNGASGTATIGGSASTFRVNGSLYGPQAEEIGGNWGVVKTGPGAEGATGIFAGSR